MSKKQKIKRIPVEKWFRFLRGLEHIYRYIFPYKKYGNTTYRDDRPYIYVGNHLSMLDVVFPAISTHKPVHYMAKSELYNGKFMRWFCNKSQAILVNRDGTDVKAIISAMKYLKNGEHVCIFPEGTRNKTKDPLLPFRGGATAISIKTKTPILPFAQIKKIKIFRRTPVIYGEPFEFTEYYDRKLTEEDLNNCEQILKNKILELRQQLIDILAAKKKKKK